MSGSVLGPVSFPEFSGVVVVFSVGWDDGVSETNGWWGTSRGAGGGNKGSDGEEFHIN
jgi:hypothetical protein